MASSCVTVLRQVYSDSRAQDVPKRKCLLVGPPVSCHFPQFPQLLPGSRMLSAGSLSSLQVPVILESIVPCPSTSQGKAGETETQMRAVPLAIGDQSGAQTLTTRPRLEAPLSCNPALGESGQPDFPSLLCSVSRCHKNTQMKMESVPCVARGYFWVVCYL